MFAVVDWIEIDAYSWVPMCITILTRNPSPILPLTFQKFSDSFFRPPMSFSSLKCSCILDFFLPPPILQQPSLKPSLPPFPFIRLLQSLPPSFFLQILPAILLESKILVLSADPSLVAIGVEFIRKAALPMEWLHPLVPSLEQNECFVLGAPTPIVVGMVKMGQRELEGLGKACFAQMSQNSNNRKNFTNSQTSHHLSTVQNQKVNGFHNYDLEVHRAFDQMNVDNNLQNKKEDKKWDFFSTPKRRRFSLSSLTQKLKDKRKARKRTQNGDSLQPDDSSISKRLESATAPNRDTFGGAFESRPNFCRRVSKSRKIYLSSKSSSSFNHLELNDSFMLSQTSSSSSTHSNFLSSSTSCTLSSLSVSPDHSFISSSSRTSTSLTDSASSALFPDNNFNKNNNNNNYINHINRYNGDNIIQTQFPSAVNNHNSNEFFDKENEPRFNLGSVLSSFEYPQPHAHDDINNDIHLILAKSKISTGILNNISDGTAADVSFNLTSQPGVLSFEQDAFAQPIFATDRFSNLEIPKIERKEINYSKTDLSTQGDFEFDTISHPYVSFDTTNNKAKVSSLSKKTDGRTPFVKFKPPNLLQSEFHNNNSDDDNDTKQLKKQMNPKHIHSLMHHFSGLTEDTHYIATDGENSWNKYLIEKMTNIPSTYSHLWPTSAIILVENASAANASEIPSDAVHDHAHTQSGDDFFLDSPEYLETKLDDAIERFILSTPDAYNENSSSTVSHSANSNLHQGSSAILMHNLTSNQYVSGLHETEMNKASAVAKREVSETVKNALPIHLHLNLDGIKKANDDELDIGKKKTQKKKEKKNWTSSIHFIQPSRNKKKSRRKNGKFPDIQFSSAQGSYVPRFIRDRLYFPVNHLAQLDSSARSAPTLNSRSGRSISFASARALRAHQNIDMSLARLLAESLTPVSNISLTTRDRLLVLDLDNSLVRTANFPANCHLPPEIAEPLLSRLTHLAQYHPLMASSKNHSSTANSNLLSMSGFTSREMTPSILSKHMDFNQNFFDAFYTAVSSLTVQLGSFWDAAVPSVGDRTPMSLQMNARRLPPPSLVASPSLIPFQLRLQTSTPPASNLPLYEIGSHALRTFLSHLAGSATLDSLARHAKHMPHVALAFAEHLRNRTADDKLPLSNDNDVSSVTLFAPPHPLCLPTRFHTNLAFQSIKNFLSKPPPNSSLHEPNPALPFVMEILGLPPLPTVLSLEHQGGEKLVANFEFSFLMDTCSQLMLSVCERSGVEIPEEKDYISLLEAPSKMNSHPLPVNRLHARRVSMSPLLVSFTPPPSPIGSPTPIPRLITLSPLLRDGFESDMQHVTPVLTSTGTVGGKSDESIRSNLIVEAVSSLIPSSAYSTANDGIVVQPLPKETRKKKNFNPFSFFCCNSMSSGHLTKGEACIANPVSSKLPSRPTPQQLPVTLLEPLSLLISHFPCAPHHCELMRTFQSLLQPSSPPPARRSSLAPSPMLSPVPANRDIYPEMIQRVVNFLSENKLKVLSTLKEVSLADPRLVTLPLEKDISANLSPFCESPDISPSSRVKSRRDTLHACISHPIVYKSMLSLWESVRLESNNERTTDKSHDQSQLFAEEDRQLFDDWFDDKSYDSFFYIPNNACSRLPPLPLELHPMTSPTSDPPAPLLPLKILQDDAMVARRFASPAPPTPASISALVHSMTLTSSCLFLPPRPQLAIDLITALMAKVDANIRSQSTSLSAVNPNGKHASPGRVSFSTRHPLNRLLTASNPISMSTCTTCQSTGRLLADVLATLLSIQSSSHHNSMRAGYLSPSLLALKILFVTNPPFSPFPLLRIFPNIETAKRMRKQLLAAIPTFPSPSTSALSPAESLALYTLLSLPPVVASMNSPPPLPLVCGSCYMHFAHKLVDHANALTDSWVTFFENAQLPLAAELIASTLPSDMARSPSTCYDQNFGSAGLDNRSKFDPLRTPISRQLRMDLETRSASRHAASPSMNYGGSQYNNNSQLKFNHFDPATNRNESTYQANHKPLIADGHNVSKQEVPFPSASAVPSPPPSSHTSSFFPAQFIDESNSNSEPKSQDNFLFTSEWNSSKLNPHKFVLPRKNMSSPLLHINRPNFPSQTSLSESPSVTENSISINHRSLIHTASQTNERRNPSLMKMDSTSIFEKNAPFDHSTKDIHRNLNRKRSGILKNQLQHDDADGLQLFSRQQSTFSAPQTAYLHSKRGKRPSLKELQLGTDTINIPHNSTLHWDKNALQWLMEGAMASL